MGLPEYDREDGLGLAAMVARGDVHPKELVDEAIARVERVNPAINAVVIPMFEDARKRAAGPLPEGPFRGVPFLLKNMGTAYAGVTSDGSSKLFRNHVPDHDAEIVRRHKAAGLVTIGKTNSPELGILPVTEPDLYGATRNPWDVGRTPGGSSGGAAAAVAAGMVPVAHGGDGGGSIRIPASCCGLFGLKPSRGRQPCGPDLSEHFFGFATEHVLSLSVRDSAAMLDVTQGAEVTAMFQLPAPERPFLEEVGRAPGQLRVGLITEGILSGKPVHRDCLRAAEDAAKLCESLGHAVEPVRLPIDGPDFAYHFFLMFCVGAATELALVAPRLGRAVGPDNLEMTTWLGALVGRNLSAPQFTVAMRRLQEAQRAVARFSERYDVLLTPTLGLPPLPIGALKPGGIEAAVHEVVGRTPARVVLRIQRLLRAIVARAYGFSPFTPIANVTGQPSMSVPLFWSDTGLPIGSMFTARLGDEALLFRLAAQLEAARPWRGRRPRVHASPAAGPPRG
jgi:amidase